MKKSNRFSPETRERAVRLVQEHRGEYPSLWSAIESIAPKIGCVPQTLHEWVRKHEDSSVSSLPPAEVNWWLVGGIAAGVVAVIANEERRSKKNQSSTFTCPPGMVPVPGSPGTCV